MENVVKVVELNLQMSIFLQCGFAAVYLLTPTYKRILKQQLLLWSCYLQI